jgi:hypothetical protein
VLSDPFSPLDCGINSDVPLPSGPSCCTDVTEFPSNDTIGGILGLSYHLKVRSPIQQGSHEAPVIDLMFDKDDTEPRREIFPSILSCLWYRNP